jgi:uncharacterized protein (DUF433 family)
MATVLETNLVRTPGVCGGRLRIDGTRMTVNQIVTLHKQGLSAEDIVGEYPHRTLSEIYTVLAWYYAHKEEFDRELVAEAEEEEQLAQEHERSKKS